MSKSVPASVEHSLNVANKRAGRLVPAIQMVWPDAQSRFPWDEGYENNPSQPMLFSATLH
jgi:hypothetical protein